MASLILPARPTPSSGDKTRANETPLAVSRGPVTPAAVPVPHCQWQCHWQCQPEWAGPWREPQAVRVRPAGLPRRLALR